MLVTMEIKQKGPFLWGGEDSNKSYAWDLQRTIRGFEMGVGESDLIINSCSQVYDGLPHPHPHLHP